MNIAGLEEVLVTKRGKLVAILKGISTEQLYKHGLELSAPYTRDPEVYVKIHDDAVSFEAPQERLTEVIHQISRDLKAKSVSVYIHGRRKHSTRLEKLKGFLNRVEDKISSKKKPLF